MKKHTILAILLIICLFTLVACKDSTLSGKYVISDIIGDPEGITFDEMDGMYKDLGLKVTDYVYFEFTDGDSFRLVLFGEEEAFGTFVQDGNTLTLTAGGGTTTAEISGKKITWTYMGGGQLVFEKK